MPKVLTTEELKKAEEIITGKIEMTLTKSVTFKLEPYGKFCFKWKRPKNETPNMIYIGELHIKDDTRMPITTEQYDHLVKIMKAHKTDVFTFDDRFYTITGDDLAEIRHDKLTQYKINEEFKELVDNGYSFGKK
jgi:hypothetical protein